MIINTKQHLSDDASSFVFDKKNTVWENDPIVNTVQDIVDDIHPYALDGHPRATSDTFGIVIMADDEDLFGGGNDGVMTGDFFLANKDRPYATKLDYGTTKLSDDKNFDDEESSITVKTITETTKNWRATQSKYGTVLLSTDNELLEGKVTNKAITPNQLKMGINALHKPTGVATEKNLGTIRITSVNDNYNGILHNGFGMSPQSFNLTRATESKYGVVRLSTKDEYDSNTNGVSVTPKLMETDLKNVDNLSIEISEKKKEYDKFLSDRNKIIKEIVDRLWGQFNPDSYLNELMRIGSIYYSFSKSSGPNFMEPTGQSLNKNSYQALFNMIGYRFGGSGNNFNLPDLRGLFIKMHGKSGAITRSSLNAFTTQVTSMFQVQDDRMGRHKHAGWAGSGEYKWGNGTTTSRDWYGSSSGDYDNATSYTNDGTNLGGDNSLDPNSLIGQETRPWNMPLVIHMRVR